jgi:hypothetical protein
MTPEPDPDEVSEIREKSLGADRIYGLLSGTNNVDDNIYQILDAVIRTAWTAGAIKALWNVETDEPYDDDRGIDPKDEFTLGSCGCTDYHMADCPLMTGG